MVAPEVVTFDFWNTLILADDHGTRSRRLTALLGLLAGEGVEADPQVVVDAMRHAGQRFDRSWRANERYGAEHAVEDMIAHLGLDLSDEVRAGLLASITDPDPAGDPPLTPNIETTLATLKDAGVRIGIICDVGLSPSRTLRRFLEGHDVLHYFDHWSFSDEVGTFKPHRAIFEHALAGLGGVEPVRAAHVGDLRRTDVAGANAFGMTSVRYTGAYDDPGSPDDGSDAVEAALVVADHADLPVALGIV